MPQLEILDTFPAFLEYWEKARKESLKEQIERWLCEYISAFPELLEKQIHDYSEQNLDWRIIAAEKIFPFLAERFSAMQEARENLLKQCPSMHSKAQQVLKFNTDILFVIYVGVGCGAGWVTTFQGKPAILFGLENIAECDWSDADSIAGLVAHEIGHVVHDHWRTQKKKTPGEGPWWQLYEEGFAQRCETLINESVSWHQDATNDWLEWCQNHRSWLAAEFIKTVDEGKAVNPFFGSWFEIDGQSETGYFLGSEVICELQKQYSLKEIALLDDIEKLSKPILERMSHS